MKNKNLRHWKERKMSLPMIDVWSWSHDALLSPSQCPPYFPLLGKVDLEITILLFPVLCLAALKQLNKEQWCYGFRREAKGLGGNYKCWDKNMGDSVWTQRCWIQLSEGKGWEFLPSSETLVYINSLITFPYLIQSACVQTIIQLP